jgi:5-formyltetrahydrofolate cyclo-ligase
MTSSVSDIDAAKRRLRPEASAARRRARHALAPTAAGRMLAGHAGDLAGAMVAGYWPIGDEIDPLPLMERLAARGSALALPVVAAAGHALDFRAWRPGAPLEAGPHGTRHPPPAAAAAVPAIVLVPLLAFDRRGFRLGRGGGYYDRTLERLRANAQILAIGLAYAAQEVSEVPRDGRDQRLDRVLTEAGWIGLESP